MERIAWRKNTAGRQMGRVSRFSFLFGILIAAEILCVIYSCWLFTVPLDSYTFAGEELESRYGVYLTDFLGQYGDGYYLDNSLHPDEDDEEWLEANREDWQVLKVSTPAVDLRRGSYEITIRYSSSYVATYTASSEYNTYPVIAGRMQEGMEAAEDGSYMFTLSTPISVEGYRLQTNYLGNGYLFVSSISIEETSVWKRTALATALFLFLLLDLIILSQHYPKTRWNPSQRVAVCALFLLALFAASPAFNFYLYGGHDLAYHLNRIEAIKTALLEGQFPVRISSFWGNGYGYASSVMYGDIFLYIPAILRIIGFTVQDSYKMYLCLVTAATVAVSYYSFHRISRSRLSALIGTTLYVLSPYRLVCAFLRASVGEYTAFIFLPLVMYGLFRIYTEPVEEEGYRRSWVPAVLGISGLILSHVASTIICAVFILLLCVLLIRRTLRRERFLSLLKTVAGTALLNLWFIMPFLDYIRFPYNSSNTDMLGRFHANGTTIGELLNLFPGGTGISYSLADTVQGEEMSYTVGAGLLLVVIIWLMLRLSGRVPEGTLRTAGDLGVGLGILSMFMSTIYFPWDIVQQLNGITQMVTLNLQFPWRFLGAASAFLALAAVCLFGSLRKKGPDTLFYALAMAVLVLSVMSGGYTLSTYCGDYDNLYTYLLEEDLDSRNVMGGEYLPQGTDTAIFDSDEPETEGRLSGLVWEKSEGTVTVSCRNETDEETYVDVALLFYKGYHAADVQTGEKLTIVKADTGKIRVIVPPGYDGTFTVAFAEPWYWRVSEGISLAAFLVLVYIAARGAKRPALRRLHPEKG